VISWLRGLLGATPSLSEARRADAAAMAVLHAASFHRGWSDGEFERFMTDRDVIAHRAVIHGKLVGFILSRMAAEEAEILSVAVASHHISGSRRDQPARPAALQVCGVSRGRTSRELLPAGHTNHCRTGFAPRHLAPNRNLSGRAQKAGIAVAQDFPLAYNAASHEGRSHDRF